MKFNLIELESSDNVYVIGDIHGEFKTMVYFINNVWSLTDSIIIVAGDIGFGFEKPIHYDHLFNNLSRKLADKNNVVYFIRGNHDDPEYFNGNLKIDRPHFKTISDYTVIKTPVDTVLCVGGGLSIDRRMRITNDNVWGVKTYWEDELPIYNQDVLDDIVKCGFNINKIITHTCPSFAEPICKNGIKEWFKLNPSLEEASFIERDVMDKIHSFCIDNNMYITKWFHGHMHKYLDYDTHGIRFLSLDRIGTNDFIYKKL